MTAITITKCLLIALSVCVCSTLVAAQARLSDGWQLTRSKEPLTGVVLMTATRWSTDRLASLRVICYGQALRAYMTIPRAVLLTTNPTLITMRFDMDPLESLALKRETLDLIINDVGPRTDAAYFSFTIVGLNGMTPEASQAASDMMLSGLRSKRELFYQLLLAQGGAAGSSGTFNLAGFSRVAAPLLQACGIK